MARQSAAPTKQLSRRILVTVRRDELVAPSVVIFQHEFPILEMMFGEGKVIELDPKVLDHEYTDRPDRSLLPHNKVQDKGARPSDSNRLGYVFIGDPRSEYDRLIGAYGKRFDDDGRPEGDIVTLVYGRFHEGRFTSALGTPTHADLPAGQLIDIAIDSGYLPTVAHDAPREERQAVAEQERKLRAMSHPELLKLVTELLGEPA